MTSLSLPQRYRHSHQPQYLHPVYHPQIRHRKGRTWDLRYRACGSMWGSESALRCLSTFYSEDRISCECTIKQTPGASPGAQPVGLALGVQMALADLALLADDVESPAAADTRGI
ncbi:hypothetical protein AVEN_238841-1 [Araneus ventricosus]|uniref:Uncharacterized protein n=1 Tax=Araneus ventricosus TaxID=182803 RepID=A0A4Y2EPJ0_ARAVE|nr:hypothetical protein AVEN_238841-1 [Araneus ventricosus]